MTEDQPGPPAETSAAPATQPEPLPPGSRLLHIGLMKTGTTAVQRAASARRPELLAQGVLYPGRLYNHRQAALALMNRRPAPGGARPPVDAWTDLVAEVGQTLADRVWVSNEFVCGADEATARRFLGELGTGTHVVVTVRAVASILPSLWQQYVKTGSTQDFEDFLAVVLADRPDPARLPPHHARHDQGSVVARWARLAGPGNLTVVVGDPAHPRRVQTAFEGLLALSRGTLDPVDAGGYATNRSLTAAEAALVLEVNRRLPAGVMTADELIRVLRNGAVRRVLDERTDHAGDPRLGLPDWAVERAAALGSRYADEIAGTGVAVLGDLAGLGDRPVSPGSAALPTLVPVELAAEALLGAMSGGLHRGSAFGTPLPEPVRVSGAPAPPVPDPVPVPAALSRLGRGALRRLRAARRRVAGPARRR